MASELIQGCELC